MFSSTSFHAWSPSITDSYHRQVYFSTCDSALRFTDMGNEINNQVFNFKLRLSLLSVLWSFSLSHTHTRSFSFFLSSVINMQD